MAEIVECKDFNCENYKDGKCTLDKVRIVNNSTACLYFSNSVILSPQSTYSELFIYK